jgi:hypothetical protein
MSALHSIRGLKLKVRPEEQILVQKVCMNNGVFWQNGIRALIPNSNSVYFYIGEAMRQNYNEDEFNNHKFAEIETGEFLLKYRHQKDMSIDRFNKFDV